MTMKSTPALTDVIERADVRMVQAGDGAGFPRERAHPRVIVEHALGTTLIATMRSSRGSRAR